MSTRSNPFEELERLFDRLSRQFEDADWWGGGSPITWPAATSSLAVDLVERDDAFVVTVDLPGFDRDEVDVDVTDHTLRIVAEHEEETEASEETYLRRERRQASQRRSVRLPAEVDPDAVEARMRNGVLTVTLPKGEVAEARRIEIE